MQIEPALLSPRPNGQVVDGLPDYRDELGHVATIDGDITLYLQQVPGEDGHFIWKVSNASIALIPGLYQQLSYPGWVESLRKYVPQKASFLGIELFKWVILLGMALVSAPIFWAIGLGLSTIISKPGSALHVPVRRLFTRPLAVFAVMFLFGLMLAELGVGTTAQKIVQEAGAKFSQGASTVMLEYGNDVTSQLSVPS